MVLSALLPNHGWIKVVTRPAKNSLISLIVQKDAFGRWYRSWRLRPVLCMAVYGSKNLRSLLRSPCPIDTDRDLSFNHLNFLPEDVFEGLTALTTL